MKTIQRSIILIFRVNVLRVYVAEKESLGAVMDSVMIPTTLPSANVVEDFITLLLGIPFATAQSVNILFLPKATTAFPSSLKVVLQQDYPPH